LAAKTFDCDINLPDYDMPDYIRIERKFFIAAGLILEYHM